MNAPALSPTVTRFVLHWGEMGTRWGVNRSVAQIHALLYLSDRPLPADEIAQQLSIARSNVSTSLKELQGWNLVETQPVLGDRREHFSTLKDPWDLFLTIVEERKRREIDPTLALLRKCAEDGAKDGDLPAETMSRIHAMQEFVEGLDRWYDTMRRLPRSVLRALIGMGDKIVKVIPKKKLKDEG